jgi:hypothetical protein
MIALVATYAIFPLLLLLYNQWLYGSPWTTGYALSNEQSAYSWEQLENHWRNFFADAFRYAFFMVLPLGLMGAILLGPWHARLIRLLWLIPISAVYAGYYWYHPWAGWNYYRFFLPMSVVLTGCAFMLIERVAVSKWVRAVGMLALAATMTGFGWSSLENAWNGTMHGAGQTSVAQMDRILSQTVRDDAVIFSTLRFADCTGVMRSYTLYNLRAFDRDETLHHLGESLELLQNHEFNPREPRWQTQRLQELCDFYTRASWDSLLQAQKQIVDQTLGTGRQVIFLLPSDFAPLPPLNHQITMKLLKKCRITAPATPDSRAYDGRWAIYQVTPSPATQPTASAKQ